jgi:hypothetical protein
MKGVSALSRSIYLIVCVVSYLCVAWEAGSDIRKVRLISLYSLRLSPRLLDRLRGYAYNISHQSTKPHKRTTNTM